MLSSEQNKKKFGLNLNWRQTFNTFDDLIKLGHIQQVVSMLSEVQLKKIPRVHAQKIAHYFYRTGLFIQGLQVLAPIVHPKRRIKDPATEQEIATYAVLLIKIGSVQEARNWLSRLSTQTPEVELYKAFAEQAEWDYVHAIPHLRIYLSFKNLTPYQIAIAEVNLAAALIDGGETQESQLLLNNLIQKCQFNEWKLIQKNCQELLGQLAVAVNDLSEAQRLLEKATSITASNDSGIFDFFIVKWKALVHLQQNSTSVKAQNEVRAIRQRAAEIRHWETVRDCDRSLARALKNVELFHQVYFGTRFPAYRQKLLKEASWLNLPATYIQGSSAGLVFDLLTAQSDDGTLQLKAGQTLHRLLIALSADQYRPLYVGQLFALTYPNESFIAEFSEGRVSAAVSRLRKWIDDHHLPIKIEVKDQFYQMKMDPEGSLFGFRHTNQVGIKKVEDSTEAKLLRLQAKLKVVEFSSRQVAEVLSISKSSAVRLIDKALHEGKMQSSGNNKNTKYRMIP